MIFSNFLWYLFRWRETTLWPILAYHWALGRSPSKWDLKPWFKYIFLYVLNPQALLLACVRRRVSGTGARRVPSEC